MATAKKSSTKKPAKKATTKKATAEKPETSKNTASSTKKSTKKVLTPLERIKSINLFSGLVYLALAVAVVVFVSPVSAKVGLSIKTPDMLANTGTEVLVPASEAIMDIQLRIFLAMILVIAGVGSLLLATKLRSRYEKGLNSSISGIRWIILGITGGLTLEFVSLIAGINDVMTLKLIGGLVLVCTIFGWVSDRDNAGKSGKWFAFVGALIAGTLAWLPLLGSLVGTTLYGDATFSWHVYALSAVVFIGSLLVARKQFKAISKSSTSMTYTSREIAYLRIDMITKLLVVAIVLYALAK